MRTMRDILADHPFFSGMADEHLQLIAGCASNTHFAAGTYIFREEQPADTFYLITHGRAAIEVFVPGSGPLTVQSLKEADVLGWSWLLPPYRWRYDARAVELVRAIGLDGRCLREKAASDHHLGYELMRRFASVIVDQLEATTLQLVDMYGHAVPG